MNARFARAMCNLAGVMPGGLTLDPFCGVGGILWEAAELGARVVGVDLNWRLLRGAYLNLQHVSSQAFCLVQGDARMLPITSCDSIVTDPPYGRVSSTRGEAARHLVESLLEQIPHLLRAHGRACLCTDLRMNVQSLLRHYGFEPEVHVKVPVHKSLVREVFVISR